MSKGADASAGMPPDKGPPALERIADDHYRCQVVVINEMGVHARPALLLVELAGKFASDVRISKGGESKDGKSILQLLSLSAEMGTTLHLETRGPDAREAIQALAVLVSSGFNEMESNEN